MEIFVKAMQLLDKKGYRAINTTDEILQLPNDPTLYYSQCMVEDCDLRELRYPDNKKRMNLLWIKSCDRKYLTTEKSFVAAHLSRNYFTYADETNDLDASLWGMWKKVNGIPTEEDERQEILSWKEKFTEVSAELSVNDLYQPRRI